MEPYRARPHSASAWPEPMESIYQALPASAPAPVNALRKDLSQADRLFMAAVLAIPRSLRYGAVTWLGQAFRVSRQTIYDNAARFDPGADHGQPCPPAPPSPSPEPHSESLAALRRVPRLILSLLFPGGMSYRPMRVCLQEALGHTRALGFISELIHQDGQRAGEILAALQWPDNPHVLWLSRDETYFGGSPMLLTVDPHCLVIQSGRVRETADGHGWAIELTVLLAGLGPIRVHLAEDGAPYFPASLTEADQQLQAAGQSCDFVVQKDFHHISAAAQRVQRAVDGPAFKALADVARYERPGPNPGLTGLRNVAAWRQAEQRAARRVARADEVRFWIDCLHDAFEIVDLNCGAIRDFEINHWLLMQTLRGLRALGDRQTSQLARTITRQEPHLLAYMRWLDDQLPAWRRDNLAHFSDAEVATLFERAVARVWRFQRALTNGQRHLRSRAERAAAGLAALVGQDAVARQLAERLTALLETVVRTSSASETINSILKPLLWAHRHFVNRESAQAWLNLLERYSYCEVASFVVATSVGGQMPRPPIALQAGMVTRPPGGWARGASESAAEGVRLRRRHPVGQELEQCPLR